MPKSRNGYDRYLDFQFREDWSPFYKHLFEAITRADANNTEKLRIGFPEEVAAYGLWVCEGYLALLEKCTPGNPQIERMRAEYE